MSVTNNLKAWWNVIWHHFVHGTLPAAPQPGGNPVIVAPIAPKQTPPAPELPNIAPQHVDQANSNLDLAHGIPSATLPTQETVPAIPPNNAPPPASSPVVSSAPPNSTPAASKLPRMAERPIRGNADVREAGRRGVPWRDVRRRPRRAWWNSTPSIAAELAGVTSAATRSKRALDPTSKAHASVIWNTSSARMAD
jgi:hypothetical protein